MTNGKHIEKVLDQIRHYWYCHSDQSLMELLIDLVPLEEESLCVSDQKLQEYLICALSEKEQLPDPREEIRKIWRET